MRVHHHASDFPRNTQGPERTVLTIGTFDGVHAGHRAVLRQLKEVAARHQASTTLLSFHPHPRVVLDPDHHGLKLLNTLDERQYLLASTGLDHLVLHPFTHELSHMSPMDYAKSLLADAIRPVAVVIGDDHRFGRHRSGNFDTLKTLGKAFGFEVEALDAHRVNEVRVSSTKVRDALREGHVAEANTWLGSPYPTSGTVVHGHARGRELGFPTANLDIKDPLKLLPAEGVYAVWCQTPDGSWLPGMANVGRRPTLHRDSEASVEVHVIGGRGDWYEKTLHVRWMHWMRGEVKFESPESLKRALAQDRDRVLSLLGSSAHPPF
ncbi:MAG: bifunctional riboflavin kinase/FAD synthetase [Bacteroidetes bacterium]|nr:bifunctional riboflavin kinase/FAD synthetase [Bacteroidota bacterium]MDA0904053.1 bifunctional riboflavin kinase/FAD synthetase [Bacteroidota bacterium]MDA1242705.1 bifunctional riboflavin kinase/FAD synthetase [Bacteroidota bacterium]